MADNKDKDEQSFVLHFDKWRTANAQDTDHSIALRAIAWHWYRRGVMDGRRQAAARIEAIADDLTLKDD